MKWYAFKHPTKGYWGGPLGSAMPVVLTDKREAEKYLEELLRTQSGYRLKTLTIAEN